MPLIEPIALERINNLLASQYGYFDGNVKLPNYRVVWSTDEFELRKTNFSTEGLQLLHPEVKKLPKYKQWVPDRYILERCMPVPPNTDMVNEYSYEPVWTFEDKAGEYLNPRWDACKIIVETIHKNAATVVGAKYKDPEDDPKIGKEVKQARLDRIQEELFGNESDISDALAYKEGVAINNTSSKVN